MRSLRLLFQVLARLIWFVIIFVVVVLAVQALSTDAQPKSEELNLLLYLEGSISIVELFSLYWPKEILIAILAFLIFETIPSEKFFRLFSKLKEKIFHPRPLQPLDFDIKLETENLKPGLAAIEIKNDDKTPMEFVVKLLEEYFQLDREEAVKLMLEVHTKGVARIQWIDAEIAQKVVDKIFHETGKRDYPLQCNIIIA